MADAELVQTLPVRRAAPALRLSEQDLDAVLDKITSPRWQAQQKELSAAYDKLAAALLSKNDYIEAEGRVFKKKSAWKKLGRAFNVSVQLVEKTDNAWSGYDEAGVPHFRADVVMRAVAPWGQHTEAVASCSTRESRFYTSGPACPKCGGPMWDNLPRPGEPKWKTKARAEGRLPDFECRDKNCKGSLAAEEITPGTKPNPIARAKAEHDCYATAQTRASNRAISDLIAAGEVSAEEMQALHEPEHEPDAIPSQEEEPKKAPASADQVGMLERLLDTKDWRATDLFPEADAMRNWILRVLAGRERPSFQATEEALLKIGRLPDLETVATTEVEEEDDLPF